MPIVLNRAIGRSLFWLALLAVFCNALLPATLRVASAVRGNSIATVCTAFGIKQVRIDGGVAKPPMEQGVSLSCGECLASQLTWAPSSEQSPPRLMAGSFLLISSDSRSDHRSLDGWPPSQPRAPPTLS